LTALTIYADGILMEFVSPTECFADGGIVPAACSADRYLLQARRTYDSSDLRRPDADWTDAAITFTPADVSPSPSGRANTMIYRVRGLPPRSSFELRLAAGTYAVLGYGPFSTPFAVKLTEDPPYARATLGDMTGLSANDHLTLAFTTPSLTVGPPLVSRFSAKLGPTPAELTDHVGTDGLLVTWERIDVCGFAVDLTRHTYVNPNISTDLVECRVTVLNLEPATIYYFKVCNPPYDRCTDRRKI
jgi:hypothetical protein